VDRHVRLLGILASLWGALAALVGVSMLLLAGGALALLARRKRSLPRPDGRDLRPSAFFAAWGVIICGRSALRRRAASGRIRAQVHVVNLLVFPFERRWRHALLILLTHEGRRLFEAGASHAEGRKIMDYGRTADHEGSSPRSRSSSIPICGARRLMDSSRTSSSITTRLVHHRAHNAGRSGHDQMHARLLRARAARRVEVIS
jgi:hypothetical protein